MRGFYAERLNGKCLSSAVSCAPFPFMSCHLLIGTIQLASPINEQSSYLGDQIIPRPKTYGVVGYPYSTTNENGSAGLKLPHYFKSSELASWNSRTVSYFGYPIRYDGPRFKNVQCVVGLEDRPAIRPWPYSNRKNVYWADADASHRYNRDGKYSGRDWLGFLWPGDYLYSPIGVPQPLRGERYFEDTGATFSTSQAITEYNFMEFETPLPVYRDLAGTERLGQYVGLTFMPFFGACAIKDPFMPLPDDPSVPFPPGAPVTPTNQFVSAEVWVYLAAVSDAGKDLRSPRVGVLRGWLPKSDIVSGVNSTWCDHYLYLTFKADDEYMDSFTPRISFGLVNAACNERIVRALTLSDFRIYLVA